MNSDSDQRGADDGGAALDPAALDTLRDLLGDDAEALDEVIGEFLDSAPERLEELRRGVASADAELAARAAHTLKANGATFGAVRFADRCRELEARARSGAGVGDLAQVDAIDGEWARVDASLRALRPASA